MRLWSGRQLFGWRADDCSHSWAWRAYARRITSPPAVRSHEEVVRVLHRAGYSDDFIRADIERVYADWSARGADFLTPPKQHETEIRCYIRDPDGHLIEVGQTTLASGWRPPSRPT